MASPGGTARTVGRIAGPLLLPLSIAALAYGGIRYRAENLELIKHFFTGPGRYSRIIALVTVIVNWKSLPFAWTVRVMSAMIGHLYVRDLHRHTPDKLFQYGIIQTYASPLEIDYNLHKSNSTYFSDHDVARAHFATHLPARGFHLLQNNAETRMVMDPRDPTKPAKGSVYVALAGVMCSFKKEIPVFGRYEIWTRVLSWDRKWFYMVSYFVPKGLVRPRSWASPGYGPVRKTAGKPEDWEKKVYAIAINKYVFKLGRLTVHPAVVLDASGLLPERPGGWVSTEATSGIATPAEPVTGHPNGEAKSAEDDGVWDWRRTEAERQKGWEFARHFEALDGLSTKFDGGEEGALGRWSPG